MPVRTRQLPLKYEVNSTFSGAEHVTIIDEMTPPTTCWRTPWVLIIGEGPLGVKIVIDLQIIKLQLAPLPPPSPA